jgi:multidrug resistance efflux pump
VRLESRRFLTVELVALALLAPSAAPNAFRQRRDTERSRHPGRAASRKRGVPSLSRTIAARSPDLTGARRSSCHKEAGAMQSPFSRTARSLARESPRVVRLSLLSAVALLGGWGAWFTLARVPVYETSEQARLEVLRATHPVDTTVAGRVIEVRVLLDALVSESDVLLKLDAADEQLKLDETRARADSIAPQLKALRNAAEAERHALTAFQAQLGAQLGEAHSRVQEAEIMARAGRLEAERSDRLHATNLVSEADRERAHAEADRRVAATVTARAQLERQRRESATGAEDRRSRIVALDREAASLAAQLATLEAALPTLQFAVERRTVRAPASGRIGETANVRVGQVLGEGNHIATIVSSGDLRVVASFAPSAFGRVQPGQSARVRLDAFPSTEYGALRATVTNVARELNAGQARVELTVDTTSAPRIPLQHGLPGRVDVTVEESSPATLVLRGAGKLGT